VTKFVFILLFSLNCFAQYDIELIVKTPAKKKLEEVDYEYGFTRKRVCTTILPVKSKYKDTIDSVLDFKEFVASVSPVNNQNIKSVINKVKTNISDSKSKDLNNKFLKVLMQKRVSQNFSIKEAELIKSIDTELDKITKRVCRAVTLDEDSPCPDTPISEQVDYDNDQVACTYKVKKEKLYWKSKWDAMKAISELISKKNNVKLENFVSCSIIEIKFNYEPTGHGCWDPPNDYATSQGLVSSINMGESIKDYFFVDKSDNKILLEDVLKNNRPKNFGNGVILCNKKAKKFKGKKRPYSDFCGDGLIPVLEVTEGSSDIGYIISKVFID
jgi:hypothetical protein